MQIKTEKLKCNYCSEVDFIRGENGECIMDRDEKQNRLLGRCKKCGTEKWVHLCLALGMEGDDELAFKIINSLTGGKYRDYGFSCAEGDGWMVMIQHRDDSLWDKIFLEKEEIMPYITKEIDERGRRH